MLACLTLADDPGAGDASTEAGVRLRRLLTALRLYDPLRVALGPVAWQRTGAGRVVDRRPRIERSRRAACC